MSGVASFGQVVILNGAPRSGKSTIAAAIQEAFSGPWVNLGVDIARAMTPQRLQPVHAHWTYDLDVDASANTPDGGR